jgi:Zn finger protein HypA/HybF involved in hydrogenase expression
VHEIGIAQQLVEVATRAARGAGLARVRRMHVELGLDAGMSPLALGLALEIVSTGTIAEGVDVTFGGPGSRVANPVHDHADETPADAVRLSWIDGE